MAKGIEGIIDSNRVNPVNSTEKLGTATDKHKDGQGSREQSSKPNNELGGNPYRDSDIYDGNGDVEKGIGDNIDTEA